ncbi:hypothetical protein HDU76_013354 [Blyttiomyces sp. JEL0837]|nr:hypothetical protein HDU76_013354 [Blyttiomyces sp. JEL0837]
MIPTKLFHISLLALSAALQATAVPYGGLPVQTTDIPSDATAEFAKTTTPPVPQWSPYYNNTMQPFDWMNIRYGIVELVSKGFGPVLVRLGFHDAATANIFTKTGGPHATFLVQHPLDPSNAGLQRAIDALAPLYNQLQDKISNADLWSFGAAVAVRAMGGPNTPWRPGRQDLTDIRQANLTDANRLFNPHDDIGTIKDRFKSLGFNTTDMAALLLGGHGIGRCHKHYSGYHGPWTGQENTFSNFYNLQFAPGVTYTNESLTVRGGVKSWQLNGKSPVNGVEVLQLPSDIAMGTDAAIAPEFGKFIQKAPFFDYWSDVFGRLLEVGLDGSKLGPYVSTDFTDSI